VFTSPTSLTAGSSLGIFHNAVYLPMLILALSSGYPITPVGRPGHSSKLVMLGRSDADSDEDDDHDTDGATLTPVSVSSRMRATTRDPKFGYVEGAKRGNEIYRMSWNILISKLSNLKIYVY
jgi:hypothetical protein